MNRKTKLEIEKEVTNYAIFQCRKDHDSPGLTIKILAIRSERKKYWHVHCLKYIICL